jgi:hypothetical protein
LLVIVVVVASTHRHTHCMINPCTFTSWFASIPTRTGTFMFNTLRLMFPNNNNGGSFQQNMKNYKRSSNRVR